MILERGSQSSFYFSSVMSTSESEELCPKSGTDSCPIRERNPRCKRLLPICKTALPIPDKMLPLLVLMETLFTFTQGRSDSLVVSEVCKRLFHILSSEKGFKVFNYLMMRGCVTNLELEKELGLSRELANHYRKILRSIGVVRDFTDIENHPQLPARYRNANVWGLEGVSPEFSVRAVERYLSYFRKDCVVGKVEDSVKLVDEFSASLRKPMHEQPDFSVMNDLHPFLKSKGLIDAKERLKMIDVIKPLLKERGLKW